MYARIVTFRIDGITDDEYRSRAAAIADSFNDWPGLLAKVWIGDPAADPTVSVLGVEEFEVLEELSARTAARLVAAVGAHA